MTDNVTTEASPPADAAEKDAAEKDAASAAASAVDGKPAATRPDWLPAALWDEKGGKVSPAAEKFVDVEAGAVKVDALAKRAVDAERELTRLKDQSRPAKDYTIKIPEGSAAPEWSDSEHPITRSFLAAVEKGKLTEAQADIVVSNFVAAFDRSVDYEMEKLAKSAGVSREALKPRLEALGGRIRAIAAGDAETDATLRMWAASARGVELLEAALDGSLSRKAARYQPAPGVGGDVGGGGYTEADLYAIKRSPEYQAGDPKAIAKKNEILAALFGEQRIETARVSGPAR